ncbi:hypothetical protein AKJ09_00735 [Labilithrix luteola]|uniref:Uncharacterized protein n=1 Tax=Labilithrix luteola TaxID=1391654 RepID=A0A0K1PKZ0_9BACT|nr:tetratricopeptide repeat protein [Labilithrix luteola]AKU94071.1 hypothetical protein AKJ09_00735 [Labilithrix luteola]
MRRLSWNVVLVLAAFSTGCASKEQGNGKTALDVVQKEQTPERLIARGRSAAMMGDFTRAEQYLTAAREVGGDESVIMPLLLRVCIAGERYRVAIDYVRHYLLYNPDDVRLRSVLGSLEWAVGEHEAALADLRGVVHRAPEEADAHFVLGRVLDDEGRRREATNHYREYVRLKPGGPHAPEARSRVEEEEP